MRSKKLDWVTTFWILFSQILIPSDYMPEFTVNISDVITVCSPNDFHLRFITASKVMLLLSTPY